MSLRCSPGQTQASEIGPICISSGLNYAWLTFYAHICSYINVNGFYTCVRLICLLLPFIVGQSSDHRSSSSSSPRIQDAHRPTDVAGEQYYQCATEVKGCPCAGMISPSYQMREGLEHGGVEAGWGVTEITTHNPLLRGFWWS